MKGDDYASHHGTVALNSRGTVYVGVFSFVKVSQNIDTPSFVPILDTYCIYQGIKEQQCPVSARTLLLTQSIKFV